MILWGGGKNLYIILPKYGLVILNEWWINPSGFAFFIISAIIILVEVLYWWIFEMKYIIIEVLKHLSIWSFSMNTLGQTAGTVTESFRDFIMRIYEYPFVSKIISVIFAIILSMILMSFSKILAIYIKNKITKNFLIKWHKDIENVSALIGDIIFYVLLVFSLFIGFSIVGLQVGLILWGISIGVGFAFRTTLTNLISGIMIYTTKEYQPGSIVTIKLGGEITWKIEQIDMKNTIIRTFDFKRVVIPNSKFVRSVIKTYSLENVLKLEIELRIDLSSDIEKMIEMLMVKTNSYDFVIYKEYTQVLLGEIDLSKKKEWKIKISFCFNPNAGIPTDIMKSRVQAGLIQEFKKMEAEEKAIAKASVKNI